MAAAAADASESEPGMVFHNNSKKSTNHDHVIVVTILKNTVDYNKFNHSKT